MPRSARENETNFDLLLDWLDTDQDSAAVKYELIRSKLTRIFLAKGCYVADELADETIDRVTKKIPDILPTYEGEPARFFYGVARNVFLEYTRKPKGQELPTKISLTEMDSSEAEKRDGCLTECLTKITSKQSEFIIRYYKKDGQEKIKHRKKMAEELEVSQKALRVRAFRVRSVLQDCVKTCVGSEVE